MRHIKKFESLISILSIWFIGLLTYLIGSSLTIFIFNYLSIDKAYYYLFDIILKSDSLKYTANFSVLLVISMFSISIIIYLIIKYLLLKVGKIRIYFRANVQLLNQWLTLGVVFFGFFPVFLSLVNLDGDLMEAINVFVLLFSAGFFVPYVSSLVESIFNKIIEGNEKVEKEVFSKKDKKYLFIG